MEFNCGKIISKSEIESGYKDIIGSGINHYILVYYNLTPFSKPEIIINKGSNPAPCNPFISFGIVKKEESLDYSRQLNSWSTQEIKETRLPSIIGHNRYINLYENLLIQWIFKLTESVGFFQFENLIPNKISFFHFGN